MANLYFTMDLMKGDSFVQAYTARQDDMGDIITFELYKDGLPVVATEVSKATLKVTTPLGHYIETPMTVKDNTGADNVKRGSLASCKISSNINSEIGMSKRFYVEIWLTDTGTKHVLTTPDLIYYVLPAADITGGNASDYISKVEEIIKEIQDRYDEYVAKLKEENDKFVAELNEQYETTTQAWQDAYDNFKATVDAKLADYTAKIEAAQAKLVQLNSDMDDLKARMDDLVAKGAMTQEQADVRYMQIISTLIVADDWNTLTTSGTYSAQNATGANIPLPNATGSLMVQSSNDIITQIFATDNTMYIRNKVGAGDWSTWSEIGSSIDESIAYVLKDTYDGDMNKLYNIGVYPVQANLLPTNYPYPRGTADADSYIFVTNHKHSLYIIRTIQTVFFSKLGEIYMRTQIGSASKTDPDPTLTFTDWIKIGGSGVEYATVEEVIVGEVDNKVISPAVLKQATESTVPFKEWFTRGTQVENSTGEYRPIPLGVSAGTSPNGEGKRPYTINSDGSLTITREVKARITMTVKSVYGTTGTIPNYMYWYVMNPSAGLPSGVSGDDVEIASLGSTRATNGQLNYNWLSTGSNILTCPVGTIIQPTVRTQAGATMRWAQLYAFQFEEIPNPNTQGLNISALADNPVIRLEDLESYQESKLVERGGYQVVFGENRQLTDPSPNVGLFGISDNNKYSNTKEAEPYFTVDSNGIVTVKKAGTYKITGVAKRQFRVSTTLWHYVSLVINNIPFDFLPFGGTMQNRNRSYGQIVVSLNVGDTIQPKSDSNNTTAAGSGSPLQFLNFDQFGMERLGD